MEDKEGTDAFYKHSAYWKKHKILMRCGWTLLCVGIIVTNVSILGKVIDKNANSRKLCNLEYYAKNYAKSSCL